MIQFYLLNMFFQVQSCNFFCLYIGFFVKVWDIYGRIMYSSVVYDYLIILLVWIFNGELFVVGFFNIFRFCDQVGVSN